MDAAAQVLAHIRPSRLWFAEQLARGSIDPVPPGTTCPGGVSSTRAVIVPRAPSRPDRRYPIGLATTGSCARPRSSVPLALRSTVQSVQVAASPCWNQVLPDVISAHPSRRAWTPTPGGSRGAPTRFFPHDIGLPPVRTRSAPTRPVQRLQHGRYFGAAVILLCSGPQVCWPPRSLLPLRHCAGQP